PRTSQTSDAPRDLHSFPTRRSSDLPGSLRRGPVSGSLVLDRQYRFRIEARVQHPDAVAEPGRPGPGGAAPGDHDPDRLSGADRRSEEHTSELQSREKLVCSLLLEKK